MTITRQDFEVEFDKVYNSRIKELDSAIKSDTERKAIYQAMKQFEINNAGKYKKAIGDANYTADGGAYPDAAAREKTAKATHEAELRKYVDDNYSGVDKDQKAAAIEAAFAKVKPTTDLIGDTVSDIKDKFTNPSKETAIDAGAAVAGGWFGYEVF